MTPLHEEAAERTLVVCCPDWPVVAAGIPAGEPAVVLHANRVVAASAAAREVGVFEGLRRREAQGHRDSLTGSRGSKPKPRKFWTSFVFSGLTKYHRARIGGGRPDQEG